MVEWTELTSESDWHMIRNKLVVPVKEVHLDRHGKLVDTSELSILEHPFMVKCPMCNRDLAYGWECQEVSVVKCPCGVNIIV